MRVRAKQAIVTINFSSLLVGVEWRKVFDQKKKKMTKSKKEGFHPSKDGHKSLHKIRLFTNPKIAWHGHYVVHLNPTGTADFFLCVFFIRGIVIKSREETTAMVEPVGSRVGTIKQWVFILQVYGLSVTCKRVLQRSMKWYILKKYRKNI